MRVVVTGATGNVGTSVVQALSASEGVSDIVGVARRIPPAWQVPKLTWAAADIAADDLAPLFAGADAVVHLAWLIQPSRDEAELERVNVMGSRRVFEAAAHAGVTSLVYASSIGAYSPGPKDQRVSESWPHDGIDSSFYARHKAAVEHILDTFEPAHPRLRVVRLRPGLIFKREAASEVRRLFAGPLLPGRLLHPALLPVLPLTPRLVVQAVHSDDVAEAYRLAVTDTRARGAYNVAAEPVLDAHTLGETLDARVVTLPPRLVRALTDLSWRVRLQPTPAGWFDMALAVPVMDTGRVRSELGWVPRRSATEALHELLAGLRESAGFPTPTLDPRAGGPARVGEIVTGVGRRLSRRGAGRADP